jgi:hypothetical protein
MATTIYLTVPVAQPEAEQWPVDNDPIGIQADRMFARQLDTGFAGEMEWQTEVELRIERLCEERRATEAGTGLDEYASTTLGGMP